MYTYYVVRFENSSVDIIIQLLEYSYVYNMYMVMYEFVSILRARKKTRNFGISEHMMISPNLCGLQKSVTG